jgi:hypothetical protein
MLRFAFALFILLGCTAAQAASSDDPVAIITGIYKAYSNNKLDPNIDPPYSQRLKGLIDADAKAAAGEVGNLDFDVFINGQAWEISHVRVVLVSHDEKHAQVRATFVNLKEPEEILYSFIREDRGWRIDEIQSLRKIRWTMSKILAGAPDAFPDEKKEKK